MSEEQRHPNRIQSSTPKDFNNLGAGRSCVMINAATQGISLRECDRPRPTC